MTARHNVHATGLVLGQSGLMIRGPSGAGKSLLALCLIEAAEARGTPAHLVADDRLDLEAGADGIVMHAPPAIAGLIELRGRGIVSRPYRDSAPVHLVVDLVPVLERMVEEDQLSAEVLGVVLPRCPVPRAGVVEAAHQLLLVHEALRTLSTGQPGRVKKSLE